MKMNLKEFFENKKNRLYVGAGALAVVLIASGGIYASNRASNMKEQAKLEEQKAEEEKQKEELAKKEKEEKEKSELVKAEEQKAKEDEEKKKEEEQKAEEEKKEQEQKQAEGKKEETKQSSNKNNSNSNSNKVSTKKEITKPKQNTNNNNNNNSNKKNNTFEVEGDGYPTNLGNSGMFFSSKSSATSWVKSQIADENSVYWKNGYKSWWIGQCKYNGKIGWTISFRK